MTDHTIARLNELATQAKQSQGIIHFDDEEFLRAAVLRLEQFEKLHEAIRLSIFDKGTASVSGDVLAVLEETGWHALDKPAPTAA